MKKRLLSTLLALCLVLGLLPGTARAQTNEYGYDEDWRYWSQGGSAIGGKMKEAGCYVVPQAKLLVESGIVQSDGKFDPDVYANWAHSKGYFGSPNIPLSEYIGMQSGGDYAPQYYAKSLQKTLNYCGKVDISKLSRTQQCAEILKWLKSGYYIILDYGSHRLNVLRSDSISRDDVIISNTQSTVANKNFAWAADQKKDPGKYIVARFATWKTGTKITSALLYSKTHTTKPSSSSSSGENPLTATTTSGSWSVTIPANYRLSLYAGSTSANPLSKYVSAKASPYTVRCTQKAVLSNGTTRYCGKFNGNDNYWFVLTSSMKVSDNSTSTPGTYYTIYFDYHGGSGSVSYGEFPVGAAFGTLPSATRSGYTFDGWYTAATGGQKVSATDKPASSGTLHAHWTKVPTSSGNSWTVTIPANYKLPLYASSTAANPTTKYVRAQSKPYQIHCTQKVTRSNGQIRYYASFDGGKNNLWFIYTSRMSVTQNGSSTGSYTIRFSANGGSVSPSSKTVTAGSTYGTLPTPTRSGYSFDGWYTSASGGTEVTASGKPTSSRTLYAHWKKVISYTIRFNANGGSVSPSSKTITAGSTYGTLPIPTRSGYSFDGWHTSASGGTKIAASDKPTSSRTLYAHWKKEPTSTNPTIVSGNWCVTVHPSLFYYLVLYKDAYGKTAYQHGGGGATFSRMYWCTKRSTLPDGSVLYFTETDLNAYNEYNVPAWILFDSDYMSVSTIKERVSTGYVSGTEGKNLIINSKPSSSYPTGSKIPMGETCMVIPSKSSGNWQYIKYFGVEGYVYKPYLSIGKPSTQYGTIHGTSGALAMNSKPAKGNQIYRIPEGERCLVYTGMSSGNWYWVKYNGVYGYAHKNYIRL